MAIHVTAIPAIANPRQALRSRQLAHAVFYKAKNEDWGEGGKTSPEYYALLRELQDLRSFLKLQLNPRGEIDQNIIVLIDRIYELSRAWTFVSELAEVERLLVLHGQHLLKSEWEKVKTEARGGQLGWLVSKYAERKSLRNYQRFASKEGAIPPLKLTGG